MVFIYCRHKSMAEQDRQCTYNIVKRSRNNCYSGKAVSITYYECVCSLSNPACNAHEPYYVVICGLSGSTIYFHIILTNGTIFERKKKVNEHKEFFNFLYNFCLKHFSFQEELSEILSCINLTLYAPCIIPQYVYKHRRCTKFLWFDFIFYQMLYMFRTILVHHREQLL